MSDKFKDNELDETKVPEDASKEVTLEENDNWEFDGTAHTLENTVIDDDEFEIILPSEMSEENADDEPEEESDEKTEEKDGAAPSKSSQYETRERPTAEKKETETTVKKTAASKNGKSNTPKIICGVLVALIVTVVLAFFGWRYYTQPNSQEKMNYGNVAMTVGGEDVSVGMYNYYYNTIYQNYVQYAQQGYYQLDTTQDFSKQKTTNSKGKEVTWAKLFVDDTVDRLQYILALYHAGVENGVTLTKEQKDNISENVKSLKESASDSDMSVDEYIAENYGEYCGLATIKKMLTQAFIANNYYRQYLIENRPSEKEVNAYYEKHKDDYTQIKMAYIPVPYNADDGTAKATAEKNAKKYAKDIKSVDDMKLAIPKACKELIDQYVAAGYFEDADSCAEAIAGQIEIDIVKSDESFPEEGRNWLFDEKTKVNDVNVITDADNAVVYILLKASDSTVSDDETYSVRHILITPESEESDDDSKEESDSPQYTEQAWKDAEAKAKKILDEYNKGEKTELSFALLAEKYSDDTESTSNGQSGMYGGLYEGVALGQMVPSFEEWSTDDARKYGDTDIVKSDYGYHIMYFVEDVPKYYQDCEQAVVSEKGDKFIESFEIKKHDSVMKKTTVAKPEAADSSSGQTSADDTAVIEGEDDGTATVEGEDGEAVELDEEDLESLGDGEEIELDGDDVEIVEE
ncbi:MAG: peptidylprolyl isomerase [Eubacterium sp.]|nr:peptidylprolyl isomerase [Eubacterium sp.]